MRTIKSVERRGCSCCLFIVLAFLLVLALIIFGATRIADAGAPESDTVLVIDHSPSNFQCDGIGTDPELLRVQAARLFITYQGAESGTARHRLGILHFGGQVQPVAPLTDLSSAEARRRLIDALEQAEPVAWTDPALALDAADALLEAGGRPGRQTVVLFSDGDPAPEAGRVAPGESYGEVLGRAVAQLRNQNVTLIIVLLAARNTSCGRRVTADWLDQWTEWANSTPGGTLYTAHEPADLLPIYHAIAREMAGAQGGAPLVRTASLPTGMPLRVTAPVTQPLASMTLTVWKSMPEITLAVLDPQGRAVTTGSQVARSGEPGRDREEVWRIVEPQMGDWQLELSGAGRVSIWQDTLPMPPTPTSSPQPTARPTGTPTATATATRRSALSPAATAAPTKTAAVTATATPSATPAPVSAAALDRGDGQQTARSGRTRAIAAAGGASTALVAGVVIARRRRGAPLTGELIPVSVPEGMAWPAALSLAGRRPIAIGQGGRAEWRLPSWEGSLRLQPGHAAATVLAPVSGSAALNGVTLRHPVALKDGDVITCGPYRIRYENLLQSR